MLSPEEPAYTSDVSRVICAIQSHFRTINRDDSSEFSGDLSPIRAWDMLENWYIFLMKASFPELPEARHFKHLCEAVTDAHSVFFYESVRPRLEITPADLTAAQCQTTGGFRPDLDASISTASAALRALEKKFCTSDTRNVLNQFPLALTIAQVHAEKCGRVDVIRHLTWHTSRHSENGSTDYHAERGEIDAFKKSLKGERWGFPSLVSSQNESVQTFR